jgi:ubiquitin carboxyl-terminal hydrolase 36/42
MRKASGHFSEFEGFAYLLSRCKKSVTAEKQFTIHEAPAVLTIHLKRFSPMGRKVGHAVKYDVKLPLRPYMSESQFGPTYSLYAVISHAGSGPNSGHYYAHIKDGIGNWHEMNDEAVTRHHGPPLSMKNAYILFYVRDKGQALESAIALETRKPQERVVQKSGIVGNMKKRKIVDSEDENEDTGVAASSSSTAPFIGPRLPSPSPTTSLMSGSNKKPKLDSSDPQAERLKQRIQAATSGSALQSLSQYGEDDEEEDEKDDSQENADKDKAQEKPSVPLPTAITTIPPHSFYGTPSLGEQKRKPLNGNGNRDYDTGFKPLTFSSNRSPDGPRRKRSLGGGINPYSRVKGSNNLDRRENTPIYYGKKRRRSLI